MPKLTGDLSETEGRDDIASSSPGGGSKLKFAFIIVAIGLALGGYALYANLRNQESTDDAQVDGHIVPIAAKINGTVAEVLVEHNQRVKAGQVLVRIDPRDFQARVDMAKAELARAESQLRSARVAVPLTGETTQSGVAAASAQLADASAELERARLAYEQTSTSELGVAEANVKLKQASYERAEADLARMRPLAEKAEISQLQLDSYVAAARVAQSDLEAARQKLASVQKDAGIRKAMAQAAESRVNHAHAQVAASQANRKQVNIREAESGTAEAAVQQARASLAAAELQLSYATIVAPVDGVVTRKTVEAGQIVAPGQGLMTVIPLHKTWVTANFKETQLAHVRPGLRTRVHVDMYDRDIYGRVDSIAGATGSRLSLLPPENASGNFVKVVQRIPVKIVLDNPEELALRPGMNVTATVFY